MHMNKGKDRSSFIAYFLLILFALIFVFPIVWVFISSLKSRIELFSWPPSLWPDTPTFENYVIAFQQGDFFTYFKNSLIVAVLATILTLIINSMAGYALAKYKFKGSKFIFFAFISTLMIPPQVTMVPMFIVLRHLGMYDTLLGIIIPP